MLHIVNPQGNANENHNEISPHLLEWLLSKRHEITSVGEKVEKREPLCNIGGYVNWCILYVKQHGVSSKN